MAFFTIKIIPAITLIRIMQRIIVIGWSVMGL